MPRRREKDYPGAWWHVMNRGIAKRSAFENGHDMETFLGLLAGQVELGRLEVHAYAVLTTHVHLLVRSPEGKLPRAMQAVFRCYVGWFNRSRKRDGSLFRGRYKARLIEDWTYWENTMAVDDDLLRQLVEPGLEARSHAHTVPLTDLIRAASLRQQRWFQWKAGLADGTDAGAVIVPVSVLERVLDRLPAALRGDRELLAGLLRELSGLRLADIASRLGCSVASVHRTVRLHHARCERDGEYRSVVARLVDMALRRSLPCPSSESPLAGRPDVGALA